MSLRRRAVRLILVLAVSAFAAVPAQAVWYSVHGSAGFVESQTEGFVTSVKHHQWGIEVTIKKGSFAWIAFPLTNPTQGDIYADKIQFLWKTSSAKVVIDGVYVSDGPDNYYDKKTNIPGATAKVKTTTLSIQEAYPHHLTCGVGIILQARNRSNKDEKITICSVGVNLEED